MEFRPLCRSSNARIPSRLKAFSHSPGLTPGPARSQSEGQVESDIAVVFFFKSALSSPHSFLARGRFPWFRPQHLPLFLLPFSLFLASDQQVIYLPAARPTATRTLHAKTLVLLLVSSPLFSPSILAAALLSKLNLATQHNRLAAHLNRARFLLPSLALAGPALDFFRRWRHQRRRQGRPLRPLQSSPAPPSFPI